MSRPLRSFCERKGYRCFVGCSGSIPALYRPHTGPKGEINAWLDLLVRDVQTLTAGQAAPNNLIGSSLSGTCAREVAKRLRSNTRQVRGKLIGTAGWGLPRTLLVP